MWWNVESDKFGAKMREIKELKKLYEELGIEGLTIRRVRRKIKMIKSAFR
jgi:hypothetical protein